MTNNVVLYTPDGKTSSYRAVQKLNIDEQGILTFTNATGDKTITTTLPFMIVQRQ